MHLVPRRNCLALVLVLATAAAAAAQTPVDARLTAFIATIRTVDNHAHPMRPISAGQPADTEFDALPLDGIPPFALPVRLRPESPQWAAAAHALYGIRADTGAAYKDALKNARARALKDRGDKFAEWALDQAGIDVMFANRIALGPGIAPPRFRWVPFDDALLLPLDTKAEAARTPDTKSLYPREAALLKRYMRDLHVPALPATLDAYVKAIVTPTLEAQHTGGAVAIKFEAAYLRPLDFDEPDAALAARVYARYALGGTPSHSDYKALQDYLFRVIAREAGRLGMAVHLHVTEGFGGFYSPRGAAPNLLESVFNDSTLRKTNFVIIHGGWPLVPQTLAMLGKPNVYADISMMTLFIEPYELAGALRQWLGEWPDKVLFGTDAFDGLPDYGWEQVAWAGATSARRALGMALTGMMRDDQISRGRAETLARMVLRDNASALYHLGLK